jgi:quercetin dioxygenase-like cupin family protein
MLKTIPIKFGNLNGTIYDAPETSDILPMHNHGKDDVHITIVARGSFRIHGDGWEMIGKAGDVIDWKPGQAHELIALEPNSRFVNIIKGSQN